jgi:hypothetical protein
VVSKDTDRWCALTPVLTTEELVAMIATDVGQGFGLQLEVADMLWKRKEL